MRRDVLFRLYVTEGKSIAEIAEATATDYNTVVRDLERLNIPRRQPPMTPDPSADWLHYAYWEEQKTLRQIADEWGVTPPAVLIWLRKFQIPTRKPGVSSSETWTAVLDEDAVRFIRRLYEKRVRQCIIRQKLADERGIHISRQALSKVVRGEAWKDVT